jgi:hypothetical protein
VLVLDQQVHAGDHAGVRGGQHGGVIADTHHRAGALRQAGRERGDEPEFTQVCDGDEALQAAVLGLG